MKRSLLIALVLVIGVVAGVSGSLLLQHSGKAAAGACAQANGSESHNVMIMNSKPEPDHVTGKLCDSLTITNMDNIAREIAFGPHEDHVPYDGVAEKVLNPGQSLTVTLNQAGNFHFHDHLNDAVQGYFTITK